MSKIIKSDRSELLGFLMDMHFNEESYAKRRVIQKIITITSQYFENKDNFKEDIFEKENREFIPVEKKKSIRVLCVEDGSLDLTALEDGGLKDGKVLVYRQGSKPPFILEI